MSRGPALGRGLNALIPRAKAEPEVAASLFATQVTAYCAFTHFIISSGLSARDRQRDTENRLRRSERAL